MGIAGVAISAVGRGVAADESKGTDSAQPVAIESVDLKSCIVVTKDHVGVDISPDNLATTLLFDNFQCAVGPNQKVTPYAFAAIEIPLKNGDDESLVGFTADVRGYVSRSAGSRVSIVVDSAGAADQIEFTYSDEAPVDADFNHRFFFVAPGHQKGPLPYKKLTVLIAISVQVTSEEDNAIVKIDAVDFEAIRKAVS